MLSRIRITASACPATMKTPRPTAFLCIVPGQRQALAVCIRYNGRDEGYFRDAARKRMANKQPRVFAYIISTVGQGYRLTGCVPWVSDGHVFFGPCKKRMRPLVEKGDYIMGLSPVSAGKRRVLLWMKVVDRMTFADAYARGKDDKLFRALRGRAIHVRPVKGVPFEAGNPSSYEHIPGAPHPGKWQTDIQGKRDVFLSGARGSWVAQANAPLSDQELVSLLQDGLENDLATVHNPLGRNPRGKHALITGSAARGIISWTPGMKGTVRFSDGKARTICAHKCSCE